MTLDNAFQFVFPIFSFLIESGPRPGALRDQTSGIVFVPLWTDRDLFDAFVQNFQFDDPICGLEINDRFELAEFLDRFRNPAITQCAIDPDGRHWGTLDLRDIEEIVGQISRTKPR